MNSGSLEKDQGGLIEAKPPELLQKLLWIRQHWRKHWKLMLLAVAVLLILGMFILPQFDVFSEIYTLIRNIRP
jgi:hypothetical protein